MEIGVYKLDDQAVLKAKQKFESLRPLGIRKKLSFDQWLSLFGSDRNFSDIAKEVGRTRERVRQIYLDWGFSSLFPEQPDGRSRQEAIKIHKCFEVSKQLPADDSSWGVREVAEIASRKGFTVQRVLYPGLSKTKKKSLLINDFYCLIYYSSTSCGSGPVRYTHIHLIMAVLQSFDFTIIVQDLANLPKKYFIIPTDHILKFSNGQKHKTIYIPLYRRWGKQQGNPPLIDYWFYENNWEQLGVPESA